MKINNFFRALLFVGASLLFIFKGNANEINSSEKAQVKAVLEQTYLQDWLINPNPDGLKNGFHKDAIVYVMTDGVVSTFDQPSLYKYVASQKKSDVKVSWKFEQIDMNEQSNMALVKLVVYRDGKLSVVDYFNLYKTNKGWEIVAKTFQFAK